MLRYLLATVGILCLCAGGCAEQDVQFHEIKHPHELLKVSELNTYLQIVHDLPDRKLPVLPPLLAQLPQWDLDRELSIKGLVKEEDKRNRDLWLNDVVLTRLNHHRTLQALLQKHQLSLAQFIGLAETINLAAVRRHVPDEAEFRGTLRNGQHEIDQLMKREEVFSSLPVEDQYDLIRKAAWITRVHRSQSLLRVPAENIALIDKHYAILEPYLHPDVKIHPLLDIADGNQRSGIPFLEMIESGSDSQLKWSPTDPAARIGHATEKQILEQTASRKESAR